MLGRRLLVAALFLSSPPAMADGLRPVVEVVDPHFEEYHPAFEWLGPNRYILVARGGSKSADGTLIDRAVTIFDLEKRTFDRVRIPMEPFRKRFNERFLVPELVHYDGHCLTFWVEVGRKELYAAQINARTGRMTRFFKLGDRHKDRFFKPIGVDEQERYFYYGFLNAEGEGPDRVSSSIDLGRFKLRGGGVDWEYPVRPPERNRALGIHQVIIDHGGTQIAVLEYDDKAHEKDLRAKPGPNVHVVDIAARSTRAFPIPKTPYGYTFSRDDQLLFVGSWEEKKIVRINLAEGKIDREVKASGHVDHLDTTPSGESLLVFFTIRTSTEELLETRRTSDLAAIFQAPVRMLYPGKGLLGSGWRTRDGKLWLNIAYDKDGKRKGVRLFAVPGVIDATGDAHSKRELEISRAIVTARRYAWNKGIDIPSKDESIGDPDKRFAWIIVKPGGDILFTGTAGEGKRPVVVQLTSKGKLVWQKDLRIRGAVKEYVGARIALMDDGRIAAHVFDYYHPGGYPASRIVMLSRAGKTLWEHRLGGKGGPGTPLPDTYDVRDGNIVMTGRFYRERNVEVPWSKVLSADGEVVSETIGQ